MKAAATRIVMTLAGGYLCISYVSNKLQKLRDDLYNSQLGMLKH